MRRAVGALAISGLLSGCGGSHPALQLRGLHAARGVFALVPASYIAQCRLTARTLGYAVPCPTRLPKALTSNQDGATPHCAITIICPGPSGPWRDWAVGSTWSPNQHLVIAGSPGPLSNYAKAVNGPAWYPSARVRPIGWVTTSRWKLRAVFVPQSTNDGSAFAHHIALIWTVGGHTYAVGFHNFHGLRETLALDRQLAAGIDLVKPW